ncbi:inositol monophosphatase family protein [Streptomyces carpinensis]|uniref:inositol-phosphate phosphatase n=1 Tax=Streptomyces carpinensis TaxID=66369 RepID=A0ABV1VV00_9ACTN|nr:inositol monophosphatase family protein [Streptomyces carpinensis]
MSTPNQALRQAAEAARNAYADARARYSREQLAETVAMGADGTPTMRIDEIVECAIVASLDGAPVNILSEETGWLDNGHAATLVVDPLDGSANGAAGVPLTAFAGAVCIDGEFTESLTVWLDTGRSWSASATEAPAYRTSGRTQLKGAAVSLLRPHPGKPSVDAWWAVANQAARVRILSTSCLEAALVAEGATDAFLDAGTDTHRLVDLAAAVVMVTAAGGAVVDSYGRPLVFDTDLTRRWSGVVAASPDLAAELAEVVRTAAPLVENASTP